MAEIRIDNSSLIEEDPTEIGESVADWDKLREAEYAGSKKTGGGTSRFGVDAAGAENCALLLFWWRY